MNALPQKIVTLFQQLGVSSQEAKAYLSLLEKDNVTGYGLGKNAGIHSSKIYNVIGKLLDRDFIIATDTRPVRYFPRKPPEVVGIIKKEFEDSAFIISEFPNNIITHSEISWTLPEKVRQVDLIGSKACAKIQAVNQKVTLFEGSNEGKKLDIKENNTLGDELRHFINAVKNNSKVINDGKIGAKTVELVELTRKSLTQNKTALVK